MSKPDSFPLSVTHHIRDSCICLHVQRAARALARRFDEALKPLELSSGQFSLLTALNRPDPVAMGPVAMLLAMDRTTLTANLKPLERRGLVRICVAARDRRSRLLSLTPKGRTLLVKALPIWERTHGEIEAAVGKGRADDLRAQLSALG